MPTCLLHVSLLAPLRLLACSPGHWIRSGPGLDLPQVGSVGIASSFHMFSEGLAGLSCLLRSLPPHRILTERREAFHVSLTAPLRHLSCFQSRTGSGLDWNSLRVGTLVPVSSFQTFSEGSAGPSLPPHPIRTVRRYVCRWAVLTASSQSPTGCPEIEFHLRALAIVQSSNLVGNHPHHTCHKKRIKSN
jgi:hypothetical protein